MNAVKINPSNLTSHQQVNLSSRPVPLPSQIVDRPVLESIQDLLTPGSAQPGFYVVSGTRSLVPAVLERLVHYLYMESCATSWRARTEIGKLMWIDSGNVFDPFYMAMSARRRGLNPSRALRSLQVARPFTAFQFQQMLDRVPRPSAHHIQNHATQKAPTWRVPFVIISDLMSLFYDPEIQESDVRRAFQDFMMRLSFLKKRAIVLGLNVRYPAPEHRAGFLPQVMNLADQMLLPRHRSVLAENKNQPFSVPVSDQLFSVR